MIRRSAQILILTMLCASFARASIIHYTETTRDAPWYNVKTYNSLGFLEEGTTVRVLGAQYDENGGLWYRVETVNGQSGLVRGLALAEIPENIEREAYSYSTEEKKASYALELPDPADYKIRAPEKKYEKVSYESIARNPTLASGAYVKFSGEVIVQYDSPGSADIDFIINAGGANDYVCCYAENFKNWHWDGEYEKTGLEQLLPGDRVVVKGELAGARELQYTDGVKIINAPYLIVHGMELL